jgi:hypothetical protein
MTGKPRRRAKTAATRKPARKSVKKLRATAKPAKPDPLDAFILAAVETLNLPAEKAWLPAIKANLRVTLQFGKMVSDFELPDDAEPAPVFRA